MNERDSRKRTEELNERARGKWPSILIELGVPPAILDKRNHPCPFCGGKDRFRFTDLEGEGWFYCNQCGDRMEIEGPAP